MAAVEHEGTCQTKQFFSPRASLGGKQATLCIFSQALHLRAACIFSLERSTFPVCAESLHIFAYYPRMLYAERAQLVRSSISTQKRKTGPRPVASVTRKSSSAPNRCGLTFFTYALPSCASHRKRNLRVRLLVQRPGRSCTWVTAIGAGAPSADQAAAETAARRVQSAVRRERKRNVPA